MENTVEITRENAIEIHDRITSVMEGKDFNYQMKRFKVEGNEINLENLQVIAERVALVNVYDVYIGASKLISIQMDKAPFVNIPPISGCGHVIKCEKGSVILLTNYGTGEAAIHTFTEV